MNSLHPGTNKFCIQFRKWKLHQILFLSPNALIIKSGEKNGCFNRVSTLWSSFVYEREQICSIMVFHKLRIYLNFQTRIRTKKCTKYEKDGRKRKKWNKHLHFAYELSKKLLCAIPKFTSKPRLWALFHEIFNKS